ncbi:MAG: histidine kinase [Clostridiales bacterium]|jgi:two-component system sensor histidine kinase YesM|nr:histidine kinase [Clostridiales bacterium]
MRKARNDIRVKIICLCSLCVIIAGIASNAYMYQNMSAVILDKVVRINNISLDRVKEQADKRLESVLGIGYLSSSSPQTMTALAYSSVSTLTAKRAAVSAQDTMNSYLESSSFFKYITKCIAFNERGLMIQGVTTLYGLTSDHRALMESPQFADYKAGVPNFGKIYRSISPMGPECFVAFFPVHSSGRVAGYVYIETKTELITSVLSEYGNAGEIYAYIQDPSLASGRRFLGEAQPPHREGYEVAFRELSVKGISIINYVNASELTVDSRKLLLSDALVVSMMLVASVGILFVVTVFVTRPIKGIVKKIKKTAQNDYSEDLDIEKYGGEMGDIGKMLNEMALSFERLLKETIDMVERSKNTEIALLQSQINPHFLYNTLDSISIMAGIRGDKATVRMTKALSSLLRNMAKGFSDKISVKEELSLLDDFIMIQSMRYMESFRFVNRVDPKFYDSRIVKMTLQPIVENAIFHGIEPKGGFGTITLEACEEKAGGTDFLVFTVSDDGIGMNESEVSKILKPSDDPGAKGKLLNKNAMNKIGLPNVNGRLKLIYGEECGIFIESEVGVGTKVHARILKEGGEK